MAIGDDLAVSVCLKLSWRLKLGLGVLRNCTKNLKILTILPSLLTLILLNTGQTKILM